MNQRAQALESARTQGADFDDIDEGPSLGELLGPVWSKKGWVVMAGLVGGTVTVAASYLIAPVFTSVTSFLPPQQQQSSAASALAALGPLAGLAGAAGASVRSPADQYVALMQSVQVSDRIIDRFGLMQSYEAKFKVDARRKLADNVRIAVGKKDGLISVEVDDTDPGKAAMIANQYIEELRRLTSTLAVTEAQQRRAFFEKQLESTKDRLIVAQLALQGSGFNQGALRAEPKAAAEGYARLKAEVTSNEVKLQALRGTLTESTPEVQRQQAVVAALRSQLSRLEQSGQTGDGPDYVSRYREFKYQETLFELFARQYELARLDESREGALIQVLDPATPPEKKSRPKRAQMGALGAMATALLLAIVLMVHGARRRSMQS